MGARKVRLNGGKERERASLKAVGPKFKRAGSKQTESKKKGPVTSKPSPSGFQWKKPSKKEMTHKKPQGEAPRKGLNPAKRPQEGKATESHASTSDSASSRKLLKKRLLEKRKKRAKPLFELGKEVGTLWEKLRQRNLSKEERSRLVSGILEKMKGKIPEMVTSHVTSRVLQTCLKYCTSFEKATIFEELRPHFMTLARNTYAHHLVLKILDQADKAQLQQMISSLHGNVVSFLRHPVGSAVVEHAYNLANSNQKQELVSEFYSPEYRIFKGIISEGPNRLTDLIANEPLKRKTILEHMATSLQPILEKGIVDHSIIHRVLLEYLSIASKSATVEIVQQLSGPLLIRMVHTKDGAKLGMICVSNGTRKEWKKIVKGLKGNAMKVACDQYGSVFLMAILNVVDDTELVNKFIISELAKNMKEIAFHKYGRRILLNLLSPCNPQYFPADHLTAAQTQRKSSKQGDSEQGDEEHEFGNVTGEGSASSKKDPFVRRTELLKHSAFAEKLVDFCVINAGELLRSPTGKDVIYEVARGGADGILWHVLPDGVSRVHRAIAELAAQPRASGATDQVSQDEHVFEHYYSSRSIRTLIKEPSVTVPGVKISSFASVIWRAVLKGHCNEWVKGHSKKIVAAFQHCPDVKVKKSAMVELQPLIDSGLLEVRSVPPQTHGVKRKKISKDET